MSELRAFHGDEKIKSKYLSRVRAHREADELIQGTGWDKGRGCAVGCTLEAYDHARYPIELGIPEVLARLEDRIFEGLSKADAMAWPERFLSAPKVGADLSDVWPQFAVWLLTDPDHGVIRFASTDQLQAAIRRVADLWQERVPVSDPRWSEASRECACAAYAADAVAYAAAAYAAAAKAAAADAAYARDTHWRACADKLIELMEGA